MRFHSVGETRRNPALDFAQVNAHRDSGAWSVLAIVRDDCLSDGERPGRWQREAVDQLDRDRDGKDSTRRECPADALTCAANAIDTATGDELVEAAAVDPKGTGNDDGTKGPQIIPSIRYLFVGTAGKPVAKHRGHRDSAVPGKQCRPRSAGRCYHIACQCIALKNIPEQRVSGEIYSRDEYY